MNSRTKTIMLLTILYFVIGSDILWAQCTNCRHSYSSAELVSSAIGLSNQASGQYSFAAGSYVNVQGMNAAGIGSGINAESDGTFVLGSNANSRAGGAIILGHGYGDHSSDRINNTIANSLMVGFNSIYPSLFISSSPDREKTGKVGIGNVTDPESKLHIKADPGESASLFIEQSDQRYSDIFLGDLYHGLRCTMDHGLIFRTSKNYLFDKGKIGVNTLFPEYDLDVQGNLYTKEITIYDKEHYQENIDGWILRADANGKASWCSPELFNDGDWLLTEEDAYRPSGSVGIGTANPVTTLELSHKLSEGGTTGLCLSNTGQYRWFIGMTGDRKGAHDLLIGNFGSMHTGFSDFMVIKPDGNVGLGTDKTYGYRLAVNGAIITEEVTVKLQQDWPDYVFREGYDLLPLKKLGNFVNDHGHLPGIPTAGEISEKGLNIGEMESLLLRKIEELTLYIIRQDEKIEAMQARLEGRSF